MTTLRDGGRSFKGDAAILGRTASEANSGAGSGGVSTTAAALDQREALRFLALLGKDPAAVRLRFFPHKHHPNRAAIGPRKLQGFDPAPIVSHQASGRGAYVVIGEGGDTDAAVTSVPAVFVEWDDRPIEWQRDAWRHLGLPEPSIQVETGGKSIHCYWRLAEPLAPTEWRHLQSRLIAHCGSDRSCSNPSRVMRLPGCAYIGADGKPSGQTRILTATGHHYRPDQLLPPELEATPQRPQPRAPRRPQGERRPIGPARSLQQIQEALAAVPPITPGTGQRETFRALAWGLLSAVRQAGESDAAALDLLTRHSPQVADAADYLATDPHTISAGSFWHLAKAAGWRPAPPPTARLRQSDHIAPAGQHLGNIIPTPEDAPLVAIAAAMGTGKTCAIASAVTPLLAVGVRVVLIAHRRSLGAANAWKLDLPWAEEAGPGSDLRQRGIALCVDSLCPESGLQITPGDWRGCVVVIDEVCAVLAHALNGTGTAIATRRTAVLETLGALLAGASQVIVADAQLTEPALQALEAATGQRALLISSEHRPAAGRPLVVHPTRKSWRAELVAQLQARRRLWIATTAAQAGSPNSAQNLALLALQHWPTASVLVVDADTVADPDHDAHRLAGDPDGIAGRYDVVICSPAVAAGLSVTLRGHFDAVMVGAGGTTDPDSVVQAAARVRDDCPRHLYAPKRSPGRHLQTSTGSTDPQELTRHLNRHEEKIVTQLVASGGDLERGTLGPWLPLWARLAATRNGQRLAYRETVVELLEREGYAISDASPLDANGIAVADAAAADLENIAIEAQAAADTAVVTADPLTAADAQELSRKRKRSPAEKAQLQRYAIAQRWGLGATAPTVEVLEADREHHSQRARMGWLLQLPNGRQLTTAHDQHLPTSWAPDLCREAITPRLDELTTLGLPAWLTRDEWFTAADCQLVELQATAIAHGADLQQVLGVTPGKNAITTLRALLRLTGHRLETKRSRKGGDRAWRYRVVAEALPVGANAAQLVVAWTDQLSQKSPYR